jgi:UDP-N-acetylglucosamine:LPS N-acetylglucosamine transferase
MTLSHTTLAPFLDRPQRVSLDDFNHLYGAENDASRYDSLKSDTRATGPIVALLNQLQIGELIPDRIAILIKNNLHDTPFVKASLSNLLFDLKNRHVIGENCFQRLHAQLNNNNFEEVLSSVYAVLIYSKLAEAHDRISQDPAFHFQTSEEYSNRLIRLNPFQQKTEVKKLEHQFQKKALGQLLFKLSNTEGADPTVTAGRIALAAHLNQSTPQVFKEELARHLETLISTATPFEKLNLEELLKEVRAAAPENLVAQLYNSLGTEEHLKRCVRSISLLNQTLQLTSRDELNASLTKCKSAYNGSVYLLRDFKNLPHISPTRFHQQIGQMKSQWEKANTIITRATGQLAHQFCSCQATLPPAQYGLAEWPYHSNSMIQLTPAQINAVHAPVPPTLVDPVTRQNNHQKTIAIIGCDWGGGHREVTRGITNNLAKLGFHTHSIDLPKVLTSEDPVRNFFLTRWLGKDWTISSLFNGLLKEKAYACINFLRSFSGGAPDPEAHQRKLMLTLNQLLTSNPDMVITTYSADNEAIFDACELLGIPCLHVSTDIDTSVETRAAPRDTRHMKMAVAFDDPDMLSRIESTTRPDQRVIGGPPVRHEFTLQRTREDALRFKQQWGIDANKKVVVIANGKNGTYSKYPELLAKRYANMNRADIPVHLVVLCGADNQEFRNKLERDVVPTTNLPMSLFTSVPGEKMEELMTMAAHGGCLIGKAGGGTLFEATTRGTRLLIDNTPPGVFNQGITHFFVSIFEWILRGLGFKDQMPWEEINTTFASENGFGDSFKTEEEFLTKFEQLTAHNDPAPMPFTVRNCEQVLKETVSSMLFNASTDLDMVRKRREFRSV